MKKLFKCLDQIIERIVFDRGDHIHIRIVQVTPYFSILNRDTVKRNQVPYQAISRDKDEGPLQDERHVTFI